MPPFVIAMLAAVSPAAGSPTAWSYEASLETCAPATFDEASKCVLDVLSGDGVDRIKADHDFRFDLYQVISDAWDLRNPQSQLSISLASEKLYDRDASVGFIVAHAEATREGKAFPKEIVAREIARVAADRLDEQRPGVAKTWREVPLDDCPKMANSSQPGAKCYERPDGRHVVVSR